MFHGKSSALQKEKHPTKYQVLSSACAIGGGDKRDRTADLLNAIQALSQLSYTPIFGSLFGQLLYYSIPAEFVNSFFSFFQRPFFAVFRFRGWTNAFPCAILYTTILTVSFRAA